MKSNHSKFGIFLAVVFNFIFISLVIILCITINNNYYPTTIKAEELIDYMKKYDCELIDVQKGNDYQGIDTYLVSDAENCPYTISYTVFNDMDIRDNFFKETYSDVLNNSNIKITKETNISLFKKYYEYSTSGDYYKIVILNDNTILYASSLSKYKTDIVNIFEDFGYSEGFGLTVDILIIALALTITIFYIMCMWGTLRKTRKQSISAIVPIYNIGCLTKDVFGSPWYVILAFVTPYVNVIFLLVLMYKLGRVFNKTKVYSILLAIFPTILWPLLAYDNSTYNKPSKKVKTKKAEKNTITEKPKKEETKQENKIIRNIIIGIKWIFTIFFFLISLCMLIIYFDEEMIIYLLNAVIFLIYGMFANPLITNRTKKYKIYTNYKPLIIVILLVIHFILLYILPI